MSFLFVSYTQADLAWANWIVWQLEDAGYTVRYQARDFRPGGNFMVEMQQAASEATATVAVISPAYLASPPCTAEWTAALAGDPNNAGGRLLPMRVAPVKPTGLLAPLAFADLLAVDQAEAATRLRALVAASPAVRAATGGPPVPTSKRPLQPPFPPDGLRRLTWHLAAALAAGTVIAMGALGFMRVTMQMAMVQSPNDLRAVAGVIGAVGAGSVFAALHLGTVRRPIGRSA